MKKILYSVAIFFSLSLFGCEKGLMEANSSNPSASLASRKTDAILRRNTDKLRAYQRAIVLGTLDLSTNEAFKKVVHAATDSAFSSDGYSDFYSSFRHLKRRYRLAGHDLLTEMKSSILAHGGSSNDTSILNSIYLGTDIDGIKLETGLRLSYKDGMYPTRSVHMVSAKQFQKYNSVPVWVRTVSGFEETTKTASDLEFYPVWTVNFMAIEPNYEGSFLSTIKVSEADGDVYNAY